ncbi:vacuolar protein sorting-associated protein 16 homolog [Oscarella lobularis]|uniref:vacuolar protein sorting-associated protein 16 homolog n=1 Tax=Oscarella lobularis TaxID=121494 RepID=UPI0033141504
MTSRSEACAAADAVRNCSSEHAFFFSVSRQCTPVFLLLMTTNEQLAATNPTASAPDQPRGGRIILTIKWDGGSVVQLGWSNTEELIIVVERGTVLYYNIHGQFIKSQSLGEEVKASKILDAKIFCTRGGTAVAVLTTAYRFFIFQDRLKRMADVPGIDFPPSSWTVISDERGIKILVALGNDLLFVDGGQTKHRRRLRTFFSLVHRSRVPYFSTHSKNSNVKAPRRTNTSNPTRQSDPGESH